MTLIQGNSYTGGRNAKKPNRTQETYRLVTAKAATSPWWRGAVTEFGDRSYLEVAAPRQNCLVGAPMEMKLQLEMVPKASLLLLPSSPPLGPSLAGPEESQQAQEPAPTQLSGISPGVILSRAAKGEPWMGQPASQEQHHSQGVLGLLATIEEVKYSENLFCFPMISPSPLCVCWCQFHRVKHVTAGSFAVCPVTSPPSQFSLSSTFHTALSSHWEPTCPRFPVILLDQHCTLHQGWLKATIYTLFFFSHLKLSPHAWVSNRLHVTLLSLSFLKCLVVLLSNGLKYCHWFVFPHVNDLDFLCQAIHRGL